MDEGDQDRWWTRARDSLAAGLFTPSQGRSGDARGRFPLLLASARGCHVSDASGRRYVDWCMGFGSALLGYGHPAVTAAIRDSAEQGPTASLTSCLEVEVAERVRALVPNAERVAFGKNGSDVLALAVRVARAYTRRDVVFIHGYHGIHDWYMASVPQCPGIPPPLRELVHVLPWNDLGGVDALFARHAGRVAAVVVEPASAELPDQDFLPGLLARCNAAGAILVFDEVMTGFRIARGGAQERFGVRPHLACFAKGIANGMPLSALTGPKLLEEAVAAVMYGLTFRGEMISLAAAAATLRIVADEPVTEHLAAIGGRLRAGLLEAARASGLDLELLGPDCRMTLRFAPRRGASGLSLLTLFVQECLFRGVMHFGHLLPCYAHDVEAVETTLRASREALDLVARAADGQRVADALAMPKLRLWLEPEDEAPAC